ncbi:MAG: YceI family protein [Thermoanaerobaculia bacterium]
MKKTLAILSIALVATVASAGASADRYAPANGSNVKVEGTSTLHAWTMQGSIIQGEISAPTPDNWNAPAKAVVTIPVTSIKSEHGKMDKLMAEALKAAKHPDIRFELIEAVPQNATASAFTLKTKGKLTIAGVTKDVALDIQGNRGADGCYVLTGQAPIRMTSFGIKPPTAMLNTIKTGDDVKVTFRWVVEKAN